MVRKGFAKNPELAQLVLSCMKRRLSHKEAVQVIEGYGFSISEKTYQRIKVKIDESKKDRLEHLAEEELVEHTINSIDTSIAVESELWYIIRNTKNSWEKMKAIELIMKYCRERSEYYESSPVVAQIVKKLEANQTNVKEKQAQAPEEKDGEVQEK